METQVKVQCASKKEGFQYGYSGNPKETEIELAVPYEATSIYYKLSGGTNLVLRTINQAAADMFQIGGNYMLTIAPEVIEVPAKVEIPAEVPAEETTAAAEVPAEVTDEAPTENAGE